MYDHIIVPMALDHGFGATALTLAQTLLNEGGRITVLHVYEQPSGTVNAYLDEGTVRQAFAAAEAKLATRMTNVPNAEAVVVKGHSGRTIIDFAASKNADCIIIGSHKPGLIDYLLGSTAARVVRHAHCAVHVLRDPE
ncbi:universal stress protein [Jannaschia sp. CCS1]|uniref:universal stress protein n=1 Tax=Jannaschia sp. (strain CCS1) TaxID=290400 RepID=UPI000053AAC1|nr:universal stress protein [Jannaschia sp. CCS1]ABD54269.1 UspA [Jannaschia sp. CCS1]